MHLFEPARHEPLDAPPWSEARVDAAIAQIVERTLAALDSEHGWPSHPSDQDSAPAPDASLYFGTAGVVWALAELGTTPPHGDELLANAARASDAAAATEPGDYRRGLLLTGTGALAVASLLTGEPSDELLVRTRANSTNPVLEFMWGAPGTMLAANALFERTGESRWADAFLASARELERMLVTSTTGARLWNQHLYGHHGMHLGAVHGFAGNLAPIVAGAKRLSATELARWEELAVKTITATALRDGALANWAPSIDGGRPGREKLLVQTCHGAPGIVAVLAHFAHDVDREFDALLESGGELTWHAGPLTKGAGLCHGTAGNGYALLALFERTRDEKWLDRARAFAMHALVQSERAAREHGALRYSLWTGDLGVALYLRACRTLDSRFPSLVYL